MPILNKVYMMENL